MTDSIAITPIDHPVVGTIRPPGSKSLTNRALIVAALAEGTSRLTGALDSQDTAVMLDSLQRLGFNVNHDPQNHVIDIEGGAGWIPATEADLWLHNSGTSIRFLTALCSLGSGTYRLDGNTRMRERPIGPLVDTLRQLDVDAACELSNDCPPVTVNSTGMKGGSATIAGNLSSQYLSALLMMAPCANERMELHIEGELVSKPYIEMTLAVMKSFGVSIGTSQTDRFVIEPQRYQAREYSIEPDASAASYFFATAAITGGKVTVDGLSHDALQGDVAFVDALAQMGCTVESNADSITVTGGPMRGIDIDMNAISDTAQTLAAVAPFAEGATRIRGVAHMRHKETDRVSAVVTELRKLGLTVDEHKDGLTIHPGPMHGAAIATYDDHRMAMSFALIGLRQPDVLIADPGCTVKTYPHFFEDLSQLCHSAT